MDFVTLLALGAALGYAAFRKAGVEPDGWNIALLAVGIAASVHFLVRLRHRRPRPDRVAAAAAIAVLALTALQLVPLPVGLARILSPNRVELLNATLPIAGEAPRFVTLSAAPHETAGYLLTLAAYFLVFLLVRDLASGRMSKWPWAAAWPLLIVAGLEAALGVAQSYAEGSNGWATGTYANRDHYAALLEMILPFATLYPAAIMQRGRSRLDSPAGPALQASLLLAIAAVSLVAIILSLSRMAFLSALAALLVAGATVLALRGRRVDGAARTPAWRKWAPAAVITPVILLGFVFLPTDRLAARFEDMAATGQISADARAQIWRDTTELIKAYPWFGCGMGAYGSCFLRYKTVGPMFTVDYAHNDYLQVLAELGIFGFCAGLLFVARVFQGATASAVAARTVDERYIAIACLASITAILLHSFVDFNMYVPANGMAFAWVAGMAGPQPD